MTMNAIRKSVIGCLILSITSQLLAQDTWETIDKKDRVAIIGAGISGLFSAFLLTKKWGMNPENVTIYDKGQGNKISNYLFHSSNGKIYPVPEGAIQIPPSYQLTMYLMRRAGLQLQSHPKIQSLQSDPFSAGPGFQISDFNQSVLPKEKYQEFKKFTACYDFYADSFQKNVESDQFQIPEHPVYHGDLNSLITYCLNSSGADLNLEEAQALFWQYLWSYGYGQNPSAYSTLYYMGALDYILDISAGAGSFWLQPFSEGRLRMIHGGYKKLMESLSEPLESIIVRGATVTSVMRGDRPDDQVRLTVSLSSGEELHRAFDHVIVATPFKEFIESEILKNPEDAERELAHAMRFQPYRTILGTVENLPKGIFLLPENIHKNGYPQLVTNHLGDDVPENFCIFYIPETDASRPMSETIETLKDYARSSGMGEIKVHKANNWKNYGSYIKDDPMNQLAKTFSPDFQGKNRIFYLTSLHDTVEPNLRFTKFLMEKATGTSFHLGAYGYLDAMQNLRQWMGSTQKTYTGSWLPES